MTQDFMGMDGFSGLLGLSKIEAIPRKPEEFVLDVLVYTQTI